MKKPFLYAHKYFIVLKTDYLNAAFQLDMGW